MTNILSKVASVSQQKVGDSKSREERIESRRTRVADARKTSARRNKLSDARRAKRLADARIRSKRVRMSDSYKSNLRRIKDELISTESTEEAIAVVQNAITELPAEEVAIAVVEVLAETIDKLTEKLESAEEIEETEEEPIEDSYATGDIFDEEGVLGKVVEVRTNEDGTKTLIVEVVNDEGDIETTEFTR